MSATLGVKLIGNTFVLEDGGNSIIYCPSKGLIDRSEGSTGDILKKYREYGCFEEVEIGERKWDGFKSLTLFLTRDCNLRCKYCYAHAGEKCGKMELELAYAAVDYYFGQKKIDQGRISFHGGGEPTLEIENIKKIVGRIKVVQPKNVTYYLSTNGVVGLDTLEWLMGNGVSISVSADGEPEIQNRNRPMWDGGESSMYVERTIKYLREQGKRVTVRMTYTEDMDIERSIRYLASVGATTVHFEPLFPDGRCYTTDDDSAPAADKMFEAFKKAMQVSREVGVKLFCSHLASMKRWIGYFCGGCDSRAMMVTHDGVVVKCIETVDRDNAQLEEFKVGEWNGTEFRMRSEEEIRSGMRHVDDIEECRDCFARYVCAGGCPRKAHKVYGDIRSPEKPYCEFTKLAVPYLIQETWKRSA